MIGGGIIEVIETWHAPTWWMPKLGVRLCRTGGPTTKKLVSTVPLQKRRRHLLLRQFGQLHRRG
jgi:hypothetical protein